MKLMLQELEQRQQKSAQTSIVTSSSTHSLDPSEIPQGFSAVGKVVFNPQLVLGHGCEGTIVYKYVLAAFFVMSCPRQMEASGNSPLKLPVHNHSHLFP